MLLKRGLADWRGGKLWLLERPAASSDGSSESAFAVSEWTEDMEIGGEVWSVHRIHLTEPDPAEPRPPVVFFEVPGGRAVVADEGGRPVVPRARRIVLPWFEFDADGRVLGEPHLGVTTPEERCAAVIEHSRVAGFDTSGPFPRGFVVWLTAGEVDPATKRPVGVPSRHSMGHLPYRVTAADMRLMLPLRLARADFASSMTGEGAFWAPGWAPFLGTNVHEVAGPVYILRDFGTLGTDRPDEEPYARRQQVPYPGPEDAGVEAALGVYRKVGDRLFRVWSWQGHFSWDESVLQEDGTYLYLHESRATDAVYGSDPNRISLLAPAGFPSQVASAEARIAELAVGVVT